MADSPSIRAQAHREWLNIRLTALDRKAKGGRWGRLFSHPGRYLVAMFWQFVVFPLCRIGLPVRRKAFFGPKLKVLLPAGTDLYLLGGKSHDSEIRLARYLIATLQPGQHFLDIGAHYGYFSALASQLVGPEGQVLSIEATPQTVTVLDENLRTIPGARARHLALAESVGEMTFYTFPVRYSEYNTLDVTPYEDEDWFADYPPVEVRIPTTTLDVLIPECHPDVIKIDVEGAEDRVIHGGLQALTTYRSPLVMEYLDRTTSGGGHQAADQLLRSLGFEPHCIDAHGQVYSCPDIEDHLKQIGLSSDNLVYLYKGA